MNTKDYIDKISTMLSDDSTYEITSHSTAEKETKKFNTTLRKLLKNQNKKWQRLINYHPKFPHLYGLPKTHKPNTPMRPIVSGIGSAPHDIARALTKIITPLLGTISPTHLKNSGDLINKLKDIDMTNKSMASLDVTSLYTNIPVQNCLDLLGKHLKKSKIKLALPTNTVLKICKLITNLCFFEFENNVYKQIYGLPMWSPLSGALACFYLEFLEAGPFQTIIPKDAHVTFHAFTGNPQRHNEF